LASDYFTLAIHGCVSTSNHYFSIKAATPLTLEA